MERYRFLVNMTGELVEFCKDYSVPTDIYLKLSKEGILPWGRENACPFSMLSIVEGQLRFPI
ncbi:hypothetical protein ACSBR2_004628 [Camellia fascicularis]